MAHKSIDDKRLSNTSTLFSLDDHWSFNYRNDPKRLAFVLSRYKFCGQMAPNQARVLELGCSSGIGVSFLSENAKTYTGVDLDFQAIKSAKQNFKDARFTFIHDDFMSKGFGKFDFVVSLDVVEHILPQYEEIYFETLIKNMDPDGICIIGTPNITASPYASEYSKMGHVNLFSHERLSLSLKKHFHQTFSVGMNDEIVHTGYAPMAHYLICLACHKRTD